MSNSDGLGPVFTESGVSESKFFCFAGVTLTSILLC